SRRGARGHSQSGLGGVQPESAVHEVLDGQGAFRFVAHAPVLDRDVRWVPGSGSKSAWPTRPRAETFGGQTEAHSENNERKATAEAPRIRQAGAVSSRSDYRDRFVPAAGALGRYARDGRLQSVVRRSPKGIALMRQVKWDRSLILDLYQTMVTIRLSE